MSENTIQKNFKAEASTLVFVGFSIITGYVYHTCWLSKLIDTLKEKYNVDSNAIKNLNIFLSTYMIIFFGVPFLIGVFITPNSSNAKDILSVIMLLVCCSLIGNIALIILSFSIKKYFIKSLISKNINRNINPIFLFIFNVYYLYYIAHNAESESTKIVNVEKNENDILVEKLEKLNTLKEKGIITEEEFSLKKAELLK